MAGSLAAVGLAFAGITVAAAQVFSSGRATLGWCSGVLAVSFVVRAAGDIGGNGLSWLSPIGWAQAVRPYAGERWWTLGLCCLAGGALVAAALWLATRRDLGSGLLPPRLGTGAAAPWMTHPLGLALRLQRGALIGWTVALFLTGVVYGSIGEDVDRMLEENEAFADVFTQLEGASLTDSFFATAIAMLALIAAGFTVSSTLSLRTEEVAGRAEHMLATPTSRSRWLASQLAVAVAGTCVTITAAGLGAGLAYALVVDDPGEVLPIVGAAAATVPAVLVLVGVVTVLFGLVPRAAPAAWIALAVMVLIGFFGELLRLPEWSTWISPLEHSPAAPAETVTLLPLALLLAVAAALVAVGLWGFRRRDLLTQ
jgi:ABC-2 type transport system permease protein